MTIKSDKWIKTQCKNKKMIYPFYENQVRQNSAGESIISYGMSSYGYDIRCSENFKILQSKNTNNIEVLDPKKMIPSYYVNFTGTCCVIPPYSVALCHSLEYLVIPRDILTVCFGKSTYSRCGIVVNTTPIEPEWEGNITISLLNTTPIPVKIYSNEGIAQLLFFQSNEECNISYKDKRGKYQSDVNISLPKI